MPKLQRNSRGTFYLVTRSSSREIITLQVKREAEPLLREMGIREGDDLGAAYSILRDNEWLFTLGEMSGGGIGDALPKRQKEEPLTIPWDGSTEYAPRFLYSASTSVHYTRLYIENSSDYWITVPTIIKHHGAIELIRLGAVIGQEFTGRALRMMLQRRWVYSDDIAIG